MTPSPLPHVMIEPLVRMALLEDLGRAGDLTTDAIVPAGHNANVLPEIEADLHQLASLLPRRHRPDLAPERLEAVVFLTMGVLVSTCLRIALQRPPQVDRDVLVDLATSMLVAGLG